MATHKEHGGAVRSTGSSDETKVEAKAKAPAPVSPPPPVPTDGAVDQTQGGAPVAGAKPVFRYPYVVAEGRSITTRRGLIAAFSKVTAADFVNGQKDLDELVASGAVVKST